MKNTHTASILAIIRERFPTAKILNCDLNLNAQLCAEKKDTIGLRWGSTTNLTLHGWRKGKLEQVKNFDGKRINEIMREYKILVMQMVYNEMVDYDECIGWDGTFILISNFGRYKYNPKKEWSDLDGFYL